MRIFFSHVFRVAFAWALFSALQFSIGRAAENSEQARDDKPAVAQVDQLVREALLAESTGKSDVRAEKIAQALATGKDSAAAHWLAGEVQVGSRWLSVEDAAKEAAQSGKVAEYRKQREQLGRDYDDQIALARSCAKLGLKESERGHLLIALQQNPDSKEATSKLGMVWYRGELVKPAQIAGFRDQLREAMAQRQTWDPKLAKLSAQFDHTPSARPEVLASIRRLNDVKAIPSIERVLGPAAVEVALAAVESLRETSNQRATEALVRFAIVSADESVTKAACDALRYRSADSYVPLLLSGLRMPIYSQFISANVEGNTSGTRWMIYQEGPFSNEIAIQDRYLTLVQATPRRRTTANAASLQAQDTTAREQRIASTNSVNNLRNERVSFVLASTTGQSLASNPNDWWNWWFDENGYYQPGEKELNVTSSETTSFVRLHSECFVRGTPVWTSTGPIAIEKIRPGDTVLAQNPMTGELAYKAVTAITTRPPSPLVEVNLGTSTIRGTTGHPYWVSGEGWRMGKQLKAGQMLHTVNGPVRIESATENGEEDCFNLVVADFNTYFVGDAKVLVHDNTLRGPNTIRVPGLVEN